MQLKKYFFLVNLIDLKGQDLYQCISRVLHNASHVKGIQSHLMLTITWIIYVDITLYPFYRLGTESLRVFFEFLITGKIKTVLQR